MSIEVFIVDAFAAEPLTGNPAAICPLSSWLPEETMQAIAAELNQSETVFFIPERNDFRIRWFTPTREVDHIGHATLAAGHLILSRLNPERDQVRFLTENNYMLVQRNGLGVALDMAALPPKPAALNEAIVSALGARPTAAFAAKHHLFIFDHADEIIALKPDMAAIAQLELPAVIVTAPGSGDVDFVSRFFAPANGVPEDSVSGVSHCCLSPYWAQRLGRNRLIGRQLSKRGGIVECELRR
ncbi:MAG: PhzF family phenazine biosynthesis protein, partial [Rhizobiales bacterium]|nr:PhzF family phenazine biosynthesis protein [Hyphomicrobiales bacterium]